MTIKAMFTKVAAIAVFAFSLGSAPQEAVAQNQKIGDWTLICEEGQGCALRQRMITAQSKKLIAELALKLRRVGGEVRVLMEMTTLQNVALYVTPGYSVDGRPSGVQIGWRVCVEGQCRAATLLTNQQQRQIMAGNTMQLGYRIFNEPDNLTFPVSLRGVTAGLRALGGQ